MKKLVQTDANLIKYWKPITIEHAIYSASKAWIAVKQISLVVSVECYQLLSDDAHEQDFKDF